MWHGCHTFPILTLHFKCSTLKLTQDIVYGKQKVFVLPNSAAFKKANIEHFLIYASDLLSK